MDVKIGKSYVPESSYTYAKNNAKANESLVSEAKEPTLLEQLQQTALKTKALIPNEKQAQVVKVKVQEGYSDLKETDEPPHFPSKDSEALLGVDQEV